MIYLRKISSLGKVFYPSLVWNIQDNSKSIYFTFDDGPVPEITPWVLNTLQEYQAQATFFCVGENAKKHPELINQITAGGHSIGNHTYNHLNGWKSVTESYVENTVMAEEAISFQPRNPTTKSKIKNCNPQIIAPNTKLFRPPYGRITPGQIKKLQELNYKIVMWEVISGDFDRKLSAENCYSALIKNCQAGSIVVFHDSIKASEKLKKVLPRALQYYKEKGFQFKSL